MELRHDLTHVVWHYPFASRIGMIEVLLVAYWIRPDLSGEAGWIEPKTYPKSLTWTTGNTT
jgi:hypothetical protein